MKVVELAKTEIEALELAKNKLETENVIYNIEFTEIGDCDSTTDLYNAGLSSINLEGT